MTAVNRLRSSGMKGLLRQMPGLGVARIVSPATGLSALSTYTEGGPYPGLPVLTSYVSSLFLKVSGTIPSTEMPITVKTLHGGMVGLAEASQIWSQEVDATARPVLNTGAGKGSIDTNRGWEWPGYVTRHEDVVFDDDPALGQLDCETLADGRLYQVWVSDTGAGFQILLEVRDPLTGVWGSPVTVFSTTDTTRSVLLPCLVRLPDDRVIVYFFNYVDDGPSFQIQACVVSPTDYSVADYEVACLKETLDTATYGAPSADSQLRGAAKPDGSVLLVVSLDNTYDRILQLGSYDYGHSFSVVSGELTATVHHHFPDVVWALGQFTVTYVNRQAAQRDEVTVKVLSNFFDSLEDVPELTHFELLSTAGADTVAFGNSLLATLDGRLYNVNSVGDDSPPTLSYGQIRVSSDLGATWENSAGDDKSNVGYNAGDYGPSWAHFIASAAQTCAYLRNLCATYQGNRVYVGSCFTKDSQTSDNYDDGSLLAFYLGGWSNQQKTFIDNSEKASDGQLIYDVTAYGFFPPDFNGWTKTTSGTQSGLTIAGRRVINTSDGGKHNYSRSGGTGVSSISVEFDFAADTFNTMTHGDVGIELQIDNGALKYKLGLYFLGTSGVQGGIRLRDNVAGSTLATISVDFTTERTYRIELYNGRFQLWYRPASSDDDQVWERAIDPFSGSSYAGYTLSSTATSGGSATVTWGHFFATTTGATGDAISDWRRVLTNFGANLATSSATSGIKNWFIANYVDYATTDDFHNGYPFVAFPVWQTDGVYVTASGGPTYFDDEWEISPAFQYPVANIMPEHAASPLKCWESETDEDDVDIGWLVGTGDVDAALAAVLTEFPGNESIALWLMGTNIRTAELRGVKSDNSQVKILDIDLTRFSGLTFSNHGNTAKVLAGGGTTYVGYGELVGCYLTNSGETAPKKITMNTEGQLNATTKAATINFEASGTETQGVDATTSTNRIIGTSGFWVCHDTPADQFKGYVLHIPAQATAEGKFRIAKCMFGPLAIFGIPPQYGFSTELPQDNTLRNKTQAGHTERRVYNSPPRLKSLSWEALDQTRLDTADPDYIEFAAGDEPAALFDDAARLLYGLFLELEGANELVVYCDKIPAVTNTGELHPERFMYASATSSFQESNRVGNEGVDELVQVTNLVLEEEK